MGNRYADDIKRIVGIDPNESFLGPVVVKNAIPGTRGIGYVNPVTGGAEGRSGSPGSTTLPGDIGDGDLDTGEVNDGETGLDPNDPDSGLIEPGTNFFDADDIIDGNVDASKISDVQIGPDGLVYSNDGAVNGINAVDCTTGDDVKIRTRNDFVPPNATLDELGNTITSEWEDANVPPVKANFIPGTYWEGTTGVGSPSTVQGSTPDGVNGQVKALLDADQPSNAPHVFKKFELTTPPDAYTSTWGRAVGGDFTLSLTTFDCTGTPPDDPGSSCPITPPREDAWPEDGAYDLKLDGGQFVTSPYDQNVPARFKNPVSLVDFCFGAGGARTGAIEVTKDGGFMIYETSMGAPIGTVRVYDSTGHMIAATDGTGSIINDYRPNPTP